MTVRDASLGIKVEGLAEAFRGISQINKAIEVPDRNYPIR